MLEHVMSQGPSTGAVLAGLLVIVFTFWFRVAWRRRNMPPGPRALPLLGNILQLRGKVSFREFFKWSKVYGPAITVYVGPVPFVVLNNIEVVMEAMVKRGSDFANRVKLPSSDAFTGGGKDIALGQYGPTWKLQRRLSSKALRQYMQGEQLESRIQRALEKAFVVMDQLSGPYDPKIYLSLIVANISCGICFGQSYNFDDPEFKRIVGLQDTFIENFGSPFFFEDLIPGLVKFPTRKFRYITSLSKQQYDIFAEKFRAHKSSFNKDNVRDFTDFLIQSKMELEEETGQPSDPLTDEHLIYTTLDIFIAGLDTSRFTLMFALVHMAAFQDIQVKVQEELDGVLAAGEFPGVRSRARLPYTEAVLHESMRLASISPTGVPHKTLRDTKLANYDIPKDTYVFINHWALHHDPDKWTDPEKFIPERFLDADGNLGPKPESWLPFSAGRRVCLGEPIAKPELHLIFAALMHRYSWGPAEGETIDIKGKESFVAIASKPTRFTVTRRF